MAKQSKHVAPYPPEFRAEGSATVDDKRWMERVLSLWPLTESTARRARVVAVSTSSLRRETWWYPHTPAPHQ
jgi:hypothetical protein